MILARTARYNIALLRTVLPNGEGFRNVRWLNLGDLMAYREWPDASPLEHDLCSAASLAHACPNLTHLELAFNATTKGPLRDTEYGPSWLVDTIETHQLERFLDFQNWNFWYFSSHSVNFKYFGSFDVGLQRNIASAGEILS